MTHRLIFTHSSEVNARDPFFSRSSQVCWVFFLVFFFFFWGGGGGVITQA